MKRYFILFLFIVNSAFAVNFGWNGSVSSDWNLAANWNPAAVPTMYDSVTISNGPTYSPMLTSDVTITGMRIVNGANCNGLGIVIINMNNYKLSVGIIVSPTSATGSLGITNCNPPYGGSNGVSLQLSCTGTCTNSAFILNGEADGASLKDDMNSNVDVIFNFYVNSAPQFRVHKMDKNFTIAGYYSTDPCSVFSGWGYDGTGWSMPPYSGTSYSNWNLYNNVCTVLGNLTLLNRSTKMLRLGWTSFNIYGNLYLSNTGGGSIRTAEVTRQTIVRIMPGGKITIPPGETLPQNGDIRLLSVNQIGTLPSLDIDLTTCPGGCITPPTGNAMLSMATCTMSGPVFIKTPSMNFSIIRDATQPWVYTSGYINNQFLNDFNLTKTGSQNDYFSGGNIFSRDVNIINQGTGTMNFTTNSSAASVCGISICPSGCNVTGDVDNYDAVMPGDIVYGNLEAIQECGAGAINLMNSNKTNNYYEDVTVKMSSNTYYQGNISFNGTIDQTFTMEDYCGNNAILTLNKLQISQAFNPNNLNLIYNSTLPGHQKVVVVDSSTILTKGKINTGQVVMQLNGAYDAHIGSKNSYIIVNTVGGVRRIVPTSSITGFLFPTGTSTFYFPLSIAGASVSAPITVGMIQGVNSSYGGSPAFTPNGTTVGTLFINGVWLVNSTASGLKAMLRGGWLDNSATLTDFDPTVSARMITNDGTGWSCFGGTVNGTAFGSNPSWAFDYSDPSVSPIPSVYSVITDGISGGPDQSICGPLNTVAGLNATAINSGTWSVISAPSAVTFVSSTSGVTSILGLSSPGTYSLLWSSSSYCGKSSSSAVNIYKSGSGTISGFWQGFNQDWFECRNWDDGIIPSVITSVTIPGGKLFYPNSSVSGFSNNLSTIAITDLIIQNGGSFTLTTISGNNLDLYGNLDIQTGGTLSVSSNNFISFRGSNIISTITGGGTILMSNLRINKTSGDVLLNRGLTMQPGYGMLDLIKGVLRSYETTSTGPNILIMNPGSFVNNISNASYVDGWVRKIGNTPFVFPTGGSNGYKAIEITAPTNITDHFTAKYFSTNPSTIWSGASKDATLDHISLMEYWILDRTGGTSSAAVTLYWNLYSDVSYNTPDYDELRVSKWDGTTWRDLGNLGIYASSSRNYGWVKAGVFATSFSPFTLGTTIPANPLPIKLVSFNVNADKDNDEANIDWKMINVNDIKSFEVERGVSINSFQKLFTVSSEKDKLNYSMVDARPLIGASYYRLKMISNSDSASYSQIVTYKSLLNSDGLTFNISPNPFNDRIRVLLSNMTDNINVALFDVTGAQLLNKSYTNQKEVGLELDNLLPGVYYLKIKTPGSLFTEKVIKF